MSSGASLIQSQAAQGLAAPAFSFFPEMEEAEKRLAEAGDFTGERLFRDRPGVYAAVVRMCAEGMSMSATARALGVSRNTVCAVRDREGFSIEQDKKELLRDLNRASRLGVEKVLELLPETKSAKDAAIVAAVMIDKRQLIGGEATSRVERVDVKPDQVKAYLDALPVVDAEVLEVISTGIEPETAGQRAADEAAAPPVPASKSDMGSDDIPHSNSVHAVTWATRRATEAQDPPPPGGGGGPASSIPQSLVIDSDSQNFGQRPMTGAPVARVPALGDGDAGNPLCKATKKKEGGGPRRSSAKPKAGSTKGPITKKKKGGSAS